ncbi:MAG TPA: insulinase family protein [Kofleriaceae bacterium]|nr:insulinase family protein [Kofleriaceae bacterium]
MSNKSLRLLASVVVGGVMLSCGPAAPKFAVKDQEERGVLQINGTKFVIMPDPTTQLVEVDVHYDVGSREDPPGKAGLAHLVEHMMFQMRPDGPQTAPIFDTLLDMTTFMNAFTEWDATHYMDQGRSDQLESLLRIEAERMYFAADLPATDKGPAWGCSVVPEPEFLRERDVVRNEIRNGSSADDYVWQLVEAAMYPAGHAYQREVGGNDVQIAGLQHGDVCTFMKEHYAPSAATVIVAGNVDKDKTAEMIKKYFSIIPKRDAVPRIQVAAFTPAHDRKEILADVERPALYIGWVLPPANTEDGEYAFAGIAAEFGRLSKAAQDYGFAYKVEPQILGGRLARLAIIRIELKGLDKIDEAIDFAQKAAKQAYRFWDEGTSVEIEEEKNREKASFVQQLEPLNSRTVEMGYAVQFNRGIEFAGSDFYLTHELDKMEQYDNAKIGPVVKRVVDWDKAAIVLVKPSKEGIKGDTRAKVKLAVKTDAGITNAKVDPREAKKIVKMGHELKALDGAIRFKLDNGMDVALLEVKSMPLVTAELIFKNAGAASTPDSPALGEAAAFFLHRTADLDPNMLDSEMPRQNSDVFSRTGVEVRCSPGLDVTTCYARGMNIYTDVMIRGLERIIKAGDYTQDSIEKWQKRDAEEWKLHSTQEDGEFVRQVMTAVYGPTHPYTRTAISPPEATAKVHRDALDAFRRKHFTAGNATLVLAGNFDPKYAEKIIRETYSSWDRGTVDPPADPTPFKRTGPAFIGVKTAKEDQQIVAAIAYPTPAGIDGQEGARMVLAEMMDLRSEDIRFKLGSTYGLYFFRSPHVGPSAYMLYGSGGHQVGGSIDAERAGESIKALRESIDGLRAGDDSWDEDFVRARRRLLSRLLGESTVTFELAGRLAHLSEFGLPNNYYNTLLQTIGATSPAQVRALIKSELDPANEVIVLLGDAAHLDKTFKDAGITDVKIVDPEYK